MHKNWLNKIHSRELLRTMEAWQHIANELDKANKNMLKIKMLAYEINSPENILSNIFNQLDIETQTATPVFVERIIKYIQTSPAAAWQNIMNRLYKDENLKLLYPSQRKTNPVYFRIAPDPAVLAIVLLAVVSNDRKN